MILTFFVQSFTTPVFSTSNEPYSRAVQINGHGPHGSFVQTGQLALANETLPGTILSRNDNGWHNTTTDVFTFTGFLDGPDICRMCHSECDFGCIGLCLKSRAQTVCLADNSHYNFVSD